MHGVLRFNAEKDEVFYYFMIWPTDTSTSSVNTGAIAGALIAGFLIVILGGITVSITVAAVWKWRHQTSKTQTR